MERINEGTSVAENCEGKEVCIAVVWRDLDSLTMAAVYSKIQRMIRPDIIPVVIFIKDPDYDVYADLSELTKTICTSVKEKGLKVSSMLIGYHHDVTAFEALYDINPEMEIYYIPPKTFVDPGEQQILNELKRSYDLKWYAFPPRITMHRIENDTICDASNTEDALREIYIRSIIRSARNCVEETGDGCEFEISWMEAFLALCDRTIFAPESLQRIEKFTVLVSNIEAGNLDNYPYMDYEFGTEYYLKDIYMVSVRLGILPKFYENLSRIINDDRVDPTSTDAIYELDQKVVQAEYNK